MVVAEFEAFFSRPVAPTRRIAIGSLELPGVPDERDVSDGRTATSAVAMLLGGVVATFAGHLDADDTAELHRLIEDVEQGRRIPQPRMRHRFQTDRIGLKRSTNRLLRNSAGSFELDLDHSNGTCCQHTLAAVYSAAGLRGSRRSMVTGAMRVGLEWAGAPTGELLSVLRGGHWLADRGPGLLGGDRVGWALQVLDLTTLDGRPARREVQRAFRNALRHAHPDHGAPLAGAAGRIAELDAARRILLG